MIRLAQRVPSGREEGLPVTCTHAWWGDSSTTHLIRQRNVCWCGKHAIKLLQKLLLAYMKVLRDFDSAKSVFGVAAVRLGIKPSTVRVVWWRDRHWVSLCIQQQVRVVSWHVRIHDHVATSKRQVNSCAPREAIQCCTVSGGTGLRLLPKMAPKCMHYQCTFFSQNTKIFGLNRSI